MLFVPGNDQHKLEKIPALGSVALILDLEDSVSESEKVQARERVAASISAHGASATLFVRVNALDSHLLCDDLDAVVWPGLDGIVVPKVGGARDVQIVDWYLGVLERRRGIPPGSVEAIATIETVAGLAQLDALASASPRVRALCFGAADFSLDLGLDWPSGPDTRAPDTLVHARAAVVLAARRHGLEAHDGAYGDFGDPQGLRAEAQHARSLGFVGKHAIHPAQVRIIDEVFAPTPAQIARSREIIAAFGPGGHGAGALDGTMIDAPVVARARQILGAAQARAGEAPRP
jgi:citrate lyase beta subunit